MRSKVLLNAIIGDICGSIYEWRKEKKIPNELINPKCRFTDDTVHTISIADAILNNPDNPDFSRYLRMWSRRYPRAGYGGMMRKWIWDDNKGPYNSYGNGSAMRVSSCGWVNNSFDLSEKSAEVTHNHYEGVTGAKIVSSCIDKSRKLINTNKGIDSVKLFIKGLIKLYYPKYDLSISLDERRPTYKWSSTCQGSIPESIQCALEAESYEDAIKLAISMGGDADTMACIAGSIAGVIWEKPDELVDFAYKILPKEMISIVENFDKFINLNE